ncbi:MAG: tRNA (adenosine(37)-N6)-threonylcarbamoyltransferase complex dimerization subunit type 1 TsaB [Gemmatimonadota bacterium]|nr:tRNA (adenosine(37)-N6)-threonylcarbamoyltransferase complex dimerization subunit type 1 TsaB [Gemmatimonadota bacterium]
MWLALDTATDQASVAVGGPGGCAAEERIIGARRHAVALLPTVQLLLASAGTTLAALEGIILADGPGSFTGLRVGAAVAKALVRGCPVRLWSAPSLLAIARQAWDNDPGTILAVSDALRGDLYAAAYRFRPGVVETILRPTVVPVAMVRERVPSPVQIVGPAASVLGGAASWPRASALLSLVGVAGGARAVANPAGWEPVYGRPAEAQVQWEQTHGRALEHPPGRPG